MAPSLYKIEIEILNFLQLLSLSNQKPVDTRLGPKTYYKPQKETKDKSIIAVKLISISDSVSREIKYFHNPSPSPSPSPKSKVERTWSDSILLCHHPPYLRLCHTISPPVPTQTFLSNQTSN